MGSQTDLYLSCRDIQTLFRKHSRPTTIRAGLTQISPTRATTFANPQHQQVCMRATMDSILETLSGEDISNPQGEKANSQQEFRVVRHFAPAYFSMVVSKRFSLAPRGLRASILQSISAL